MKGDFYTSSPLEKYFLFACPSLFGGGGDELILSSIVLDCLATSSPQHGKSEKGSSTQVPMYKRQSRLLLLCCAAPPFAASAARQDEARAGGGNKAPRVRPLFYCVEFSSLSFFLFL